MHVKKDQNEAKKRDLPLRVEMGPVIKIVVDQDGFMNPWPSDHLLATMCHRDALSLLLSEQGSVVR